MMLTSNCIKVFFFSFFVVLERGLSLCDLEIKRVSSWLENFDLGVLDY